MTMTELTPALLDLMEHEKPIEHYLDSRIDAGYALLHIREHSKFRAAGFDTFEAYCRGRWGWESDSRPRQLIAAARTTMAIEAAGVTAVTPTSERQTRPLGALPIEERAEVWADAVDHADGEQPTTADVLDAVERRRGRPPIRREHPAPYSDRLLDTIASRVAGAGRVLDPFAGIGRIHELRERAGVAETIGVEIEPEWAAKHPDTICGDALALDELIDPGSVDAVVTSPTYGNRMADHHNATDDSVRLTYKHTLGRDLHEHSSGQLQWGDQYRAFHRAAWEQAVRTIKPGGLFVLNIKDHTRDGAKQEVVAWHVDTLCRQLGLECIAVDHVPTVGLAAAAGSNSVIRQSGEFVITFRKGDA